MPPEVEALPISVSLKGEGPHWSPRTSSLYLIDMMDPKILRYHPDTQTIYSCKIDSTFLGFVTPVSGSDDRFVLGTDLSLLEVKWDGISEEPISQRVVTTLEDENTENRINDGKADPTGRLWFGTLKAENSMEGKQGSLFSYTKGSGLQRHVSDIAISNGITFDEKSNILYYIDSMKRTVDAFDFNPTEGRIGGRRVAFDLEKNGLQENEKLFYPDGMTIDSEGKLWVALFYGSRVVQVDPEVGKVVSEVHIPTGPVTSCAWGGPDLKDLYVTSMEMESEHNSGKVYRVRGTGSRGLPMYEAVL